MKYLFTHLFLLGLALCCGNIAFAQIPNFIINPQDTTVEVGAELSIDVTVENFTELTVIGYNVRWNTDILEYQSLSNINTELPMFTEGTAVSGAGGANGSVSVSWITPDIITPATYSLDDGTVLFTINFLAVGSGTTDLSITDLEVADAQVEPTDGEVQDGSVTVTGDDGGGGGNPDGPVVLEVGTGSDSTGTTVCVPVTVSNFLEMDGMQFTIEYDDSVLEFDGSQNLNLTDLSAASFNPVGDGMVRFSWFNQTDTAGISLEDGTRIFDLCFTLIGAGQSSSAVSITGNSISIEGTRNNEPIDVNASNGRIDVSGMGEGINGLTVRASQESVNAGQSVCVNISVSNFVNLEGLQYTLEWNPNVISFDSVAFTGNLEDLGVANFGTTNVDNGRLLLTWNDQTLPVGLTLPNGTVIYQVCFTAVGAEGTSSPIDFVAPTEAIANGELLEFNGVPGNVAINEDITVIDCPDDAFPVCASNEEVGIGEEVCVVVTAQNFNTIVSMQFSMGWNTSLLEFQSINLDDTELGALTAASFGQTRIEEGKLSVSWFDQVTPDVSGVTLPNGAELFKLCFTTLAEGVAPVRFTEDPQDYEIIVGVTEQPFNGNNGSVTIGSASCLPADLSADTVTDVTCTGADDGAISINVEGTGPFTYSWQGPGGFTATTKDISGLTPGNYTVMVMSCAPSVSMTFSVDEPNELTATSTPGDVVCRGAGDGSINLNVNGGTGTYSYNWDNGLPAQQNQSGLSAGTYNVTVTDSNDCTTEVSNIEITAPMEALDVQVATTDVACGGDATGAIDLTITGGRQDYTIAWSDASSDTDRDGLTAGTYTVTVTDAGGCSIMNEIEIANENPPIAVSDSIITSITPDAGGSIQLTVTGGDGNYTFAWSGPNGFTADTEDVADLTMPGTYCLTITDGNGCTFEKCSNLSAPLAVSGTIQNTCNGMQNGSINLDVVGGFAPYTYEWNDGSTMEDRSMLGANIYFVTVTDDEGNSTVSNFTIAESTSIVANPAISSETGSQINDNGEIMLNVTGGTTPYDFQWSSGDTTATINGLNAGDYTVTITDGNGCTTENTFTVSYEPTAPTLADTRITDVTCEGENDGALSFVVRNGDPTYTITFDDDFSATLNNYNDTLTRTGLEAGDYAFTITDANGLTTPMMLTIDAPDVFDVNASVFSNTNPNTCNGQLQLTVAGGNGNYTYQWSDGSTTRNLVGLCAGSYTVTISDGSACSQVETFNLTLFNAEANPSDADCPEGSNTGALDLSLSGGAGPFTYLWTDQDGNELSVMEDLQNVEAGNYTVEITEASGNVLTRTFNIGSISELDVQVDRTDYNGFNVSCTGDTDARLLAEGLNSSNYTYEWTANGQTVSGAVLQNVGAGTYTITVRDGTCANSRDITVTEPPALEAMMDVMSIRCNGDRDGEAMIVPMGGVPISANEPYLYSWSHDENNTFPAAIGLESGSYTVTVTDRNACTLTETFDIGEPAPLIVNLETTPFENNQGGTATAFVMGGLEPYSYRWAPSGSMQPQLEDLKPGDYSLTVTDMNGCERVVVAEIVDFDECLNAKNIITPNGDGMNDIFTISCVESFPNPRLEVYSRWGQQVYVQDNYDNTWEGTEVGGAELPEGVYFYVLQYENNAGQMQQRQGSVTILRKE